MTTGAIILFGLAIIFAIIGIICSIITRTPEYLLLLIFSIVFSIIGLAIQYPVPTENDVKSGKAYYVEQNHIEIVNGDTINNYKTYQIEWSQNTK